ncbi:alpha-N-acetylgalactosaminide alpha-2,6-sialyltransferase 5-like isoform X4 [Ptychodera flava]|uniref:alpha-N-acetylgalactosaminide alpha-2,6-sialyltransferase 5-like isoform X4 n=1 Tax=Ptychodera flava TaxID=63121 RepID=UPI00396AA7C7
MNQCLQKCFVLVLVLVVAVTLVIYVYTDPKVHHGMLHEANSTVTSITATHFDSALPVIRGHEKLTNLSGFVSLLSPDKILSKSYNDCAIISSSGHMLKSGVGSQIDKAGCVIRMNDALIKGFEKDVGCRTTVRVIAHSAVKNVNKYKSQLLSGCAKPDICIVWGPVYSMRTDGKGYAYNLARKLALEFKNIEFYMLTQEQMNLTDKTYETALGATRKETGSWLTTGWFTMVIAVNLCKSSKVYGMVQDDFCKVKN